MPPLLISDHNGSREVSCVKRFLLFGPPPPGWRHAPIEDLHYKASFPQCRDDALLYPMATSRPWQSGHLHPNNSVYNVDI